MASQQQKSKKQTTKNGNARVLVAKNIQVVDAARERKKKVAMHTIRGSRSKAAIGDDTSTDSSGPSKPYRRSSRLNRTPAMTEAPVQSKHNKDANAAVASRKVLPRSFTPLHEEADAQGSSEEVQDLRQQLQEERRQSSHTSVIAICLHSYTEPDKNRLLRHAAEKQMSKTLEMIAKPNGSVGSAGFSLIAAMRLDKNKPKEKMLYNDILVSCKVVRDNRHYINATLWSRHQFVHSPSVLVSTLVADIKTSP